MKKPSFFIALIFVLTVEIIALIVFAVRTPDTALSTVEVNEVVQSVTQDFQSIAEHKNQTALDYVVLDNNEKVLFRTKRNLTENANAAVTHRDTVIDIKIQDTVVGKVIIYNDAAQKLQSYKQTTITVISVVIAVQCVLCILYALYIHRTVIKPFGKLKGFAERVAGGNLDIPLEMDRRNLFGAFTESFDIMRSELKKARFAEAAAQRSKKELVAKLSHDIKTPVASIKAVSEVGLAVSKNGKDRANYSQIIGKADQINELVTNLFTATLEELEQLTVTNSAVTSAQVKDMLVNADYLHRAHIPDLPQCLVYADGLRLQQVFDNIFFNSYKYANTDISVTFRKTDKRLSVIIEDYGGGLPQEELPTVKDKFFRGSNAAKTEGAGLGLFIADYFMNEMHGALAVENGARGLRLTVSLLLSGKN